MAGNAPLPLIVAKPRSALPHFVSVPSAASHLVSALYLYRNWLNLLSIYAEDARNALPLRLFALMASGVWSPGPREMANETEPFDT